MTTGLWACAIFANLAKDFLAQCYRSVSQLSPMSCQLVNEWLSKLNTPNVSKPRCHRDPNLTLSRYIGEINEYRFISKHETHGSGNDTCFLM